MTYQERHLWESGHCPVFPVVCCDLLRSAAIGCDLLRSAGRIGEEPQGILGALENDDRKGVSMTNAAEAKTKDRKNEGR